MSQRSSGDVEQLMGSSNSAFLYGSESSSLTGSQKTLAAAYTGDRVTDLAKGTIEDLIAIAYKLERTLLILILFTGFLHPLTAVLKYQSWEKGFMELLSFEIVDVVFFFLLLGLLEEPLQTCSAILSNDHIYLTEQQDTTEYSPTLRTVIAIVLSVVKLLVFLNNYFFFRLCVSVVRLVLRLLLIVTRVADIRTILPSWTPSIVDEYLAAFLN